MRRSSTVRAAVALGAAVAVIGGSVAQAAELVVAELDGAAGSVDAVAGAAATPFTISLSASGSVACGSAHTAQVPTAYSVDAAGVVTSSTPSSAKSFVASAGTGANCPITWSGAPTAQTVAAAVTVHADTPAGQYSIAVPSTRTSSNTTQGKLDDTTATTVTFVVSRPVVVAPPNTAPSVSVFGPAAGATYVRGSVPAASCTVSDAEDSNESATPVFDRRGLNNSGVGTESVSCSYTDAGDLSDSDMVTYSIVAPNTAPVVTVTGGVNGQTYEKGIDAVPAVGCNIADAEQSGVTTSPVVVPNLDQFGLGTVQVTCSWTDAGNLSDSQVATYTITDTTRPTIEGAATPATALTGWWNAATGAPTVTFTCGDAGSGIKSCLADGQTGRSKTLVEGANQSVSGTATDNVNLTGTTTLSDLDVDLTAPSVYFTSVPPAPASGWYNDDVLATFTATDGTSGLVSDTQQRTITGEGSGLTVSSAAVTDIAGNTRGAGAATSSGVNIDRTAPTITGITGLSSGQAYKFGQSPAFFACTAVDQALLSGLKDCTVQIDPSVATAARNLHAVGAHTAVATATDNAGNTAQLSIGYVVSPQVMTGFYQPVDMGGVLNTVKAGSTIPLKFEIFRDVNKTDEVTSTAGIVGKAVATNCTTGAVTDEIEFTTTETAGLRYDTTGGQFIYNFKTSKTISCYSVTVTAADGVTNKEALFKTR